MLIISGAINDLKYLFTDQAAQIGDIMQLFEC